MLNPIKSCNRISRVLAAATALFVFLVNCPWALAETGPSHNTANTGNVTVLTPASIAGQQNVTVSKGTTAVIDFGAASVLNVTGNFLNLGTVYAISTNPQVTIGTLNANNIFNQQGGTLTSVIPNGGLAGFNPLVGNLSLILNAVQNIVNAGTISSAANLTMNAGGSIINQLPAGATGPSPVIQAMNNVNLNTANLINAGTIASLASNINIAALTANIAVNNVGGQLKAMNGAINARDSHFTGKNDFSLLGGDLLASSR